MRYTLASLLALFVFLVAARPPSKISHGKCASTNVSQALLAAHRAAASLKVKHLASRDESADFNDPVAIDVFAHVFSISASGEQPHTNKTIQSHMSSLNRAFRTAKISFNLINTTWNVKPHLAEGKDDKRMKYLHHRGDNRDLNVYYVHHSSEEDDSAFAEFPDQATDHLGVLSDGVTIPAWASTEQATFVHEVGHWLGLLHTFHYGPEPDNGCIGDGDMISDTPAHRNASWECPSDPPLNTCPSLPGDDPVHNYMNDLPDECYEGYWDRGFTNEQIKHVRSLLKQFRSESIPKPTWPSELKRLTPSDKGGKLPFYPEPENPVLTFLQCGSTDNGTVPEAPEEYCGTLYFCNAAAKRQVSDIEQVDDVLQATLRCAKQRDPSQTL